MDPGDQLPGEDRGDGGGGLGAGHGMVIGPAGVEADEHGRTELFHGGFLLDVDPWHVLAGWVLVTLGIRVV
ncbi:hypothetical protein [Kocuria sp. SM24M-10]|uniref:hypothetical protein n=1 Tax=Kocuria sp. SM24M-10 TaxID=1660349 RepID=UPI000649FF47|nr:hypothetical protein [Kocuria sp. SM24M-10]KLU08328.1 hypothetical protein ABL57_18555 [Kocuria sp. SM24M-10]